MKFMNRYIISILCLLLFGSCQDEHNPVYPNLPAESEPSILLSISSPGRMGTRYVDDDAKIENDSLFVIYFQRKNTPNMLTTAAPQLVPYVSTVGSDTVTYRLTNYPDGDSIRIMFVANIPKTVIMQRVKAGMTFPEVKDSLYYHIGRSIWDVNLPQSASPVETYVPMYAVTDTLELPQSVLEDLYVKDKSLPVTDVRSATTYNLIRMMAKIRIINKKTSYIGDGKLSPFRLDMVQLRNAKDTGYIYHHDLSDPDYWSVTHKRVKTPNLYYKTLPWVPVGTKSETIANVTYDAAKSAQEVEFYTYETGVKDSKQAASQNNCHIVLTGQVTYQRESGKPETQGTYNLSYLLPIPTIEEEASKLVVNKDIPGPLLRNHCYIYTIEGVLNFRTLVVTVKVSDWTEADYYVDLD